MSQVVAQDISDSLFSRKSHFLLRRLHSLTGIIFGLYLIIHLFINATLMQGTSPDIYQKQVDKIHEMPFLVLLEWLLIYLPLIFHVIYGLFITVNGQPNVANYPFAKNWFYLAQRISAIVLMVFILFHVLGMKGQFGTMLEFDPQHATQSTARHIKASFLLSFFVYPIGILAACFHLANGFWTAAITWGLTISAGGQRRWGYVCVGIFAFTFIYGFGALLAAICHR